MQFRKERTDFGKQRIIFNLGHAWKRWYFSECNTRSGKGFPHSTEAALFLICDPLLRTKQEVSGRNKLWASLKSFPPVRFNSYNLSSGFLSISFTSCHRWVSLIVSREALQHCLQIDLPLLYRTCSADCLAMRALPWKAEIAMLLCQGGVSLCCQKRGIGYFLCCTQHVCIQTSTCPAGSRNVKSHHPVCFQTRVEAALIES